MEIETHELVFDTGREDIDIIDITREIRKVIEGWKEGFVNVFVQGSTAGVTVMEYESGLIKDIREFFEEIIPKNRNYAHNLTWGDANGHSHLRASLLKPSLTIPFKDGKDFLGTWQQVVVLDFDNKRRKRKIILQVVGEK
ncbi:secondary thiamine-phosphate synthase enzyme [Archaeoglobus sulfaticallidus PM70-1]|uniref:Secondary thiamine-phosphate synthase enzyme n=1 Tax=Archaeoglobus sulfaticallidus PM70-1 TaxID=387631 RepID=N0BMK5_9EURY|nr:secondary thiamine-phosphate synthase enzyme YjbQ [Archaeoglobus sulfaticallidus]AGK61861.1 secondary thiamine-phosphate synthase enzyme [Archaeoglobus sulfaticallidus PM70-1]